jgi:hypothetical protein
MKNQPKQYDDDDGRVICDMDVDGMPWHDRRVQREQREAPKVQHPDQMTAAETRAYTGSALLAALVIWAVFAAAWALLILFCTQIWFR